MRLTTYTPKSTIHLCTLAVFATILLVCNTLSRLPNLTRTSNPATSPTLYGSVLMCAMTCTVPLAVHHMTASLLLVTPSFTPLFRKSCLLPPGKITLPLSSLGMRTRPPPLDVVIVLQVQTA